MLQFVTWLKFMDTQILQKKKGTQGVIQIENPNLVKAKNVKAKDVDVSPLLLLLASRADLFPFGSMAFEISSKRSLQCHVLIADEHSDLQMDRPAELSRRER
jgi:hypothetical protein